MSVVIKVEGLGKQYRLGMVGTGTLVHDLNRWWHQVRGKEDPNLKLGEVNDRALKADGNDLVWALKDINFEVQKGEVLGIIGKNGAGKSTLLKILSKVTSPTVGQVKIKGRIASLLEVGTGFHPELSGKENIFLNGAILGMTKKEVRAKFDEIVDFSGVERYIDTPVKRYSSGMYVRLAFAVAAHLEPEILIIDEVLAVGDAEFQKKCLGKMKDVSGQGRTVLFVSHNMTAVRSLCTRGLLLENGLLAKSGPIGDVIDQYFGKSEISTRSVYVFEEKKSKEAQITKISILDPKGVASSEVDLNQPLSLVIEYVIREPITGLCAGFSISQAKESDVLISSNEAELHPERLKARPAGSYKNTIRIPAKTLNVGRYRLRAGITSHKN
ncbi:MAG: ABC transporter ATP-binding protein, partial [Burkholderiales bacterium]|nr:ABC transporter ATP-binding protein [Burkholderiales bacterium]